MAQFTRMLTALILAALIGACSPAESATPTAPSSANLLPTIAPSSAPLPTAAPAAAQPTTTLPPAGSAPDQPIGVDSWMPGNKQGVGTAFTYDQPAGETNPSRVWFGIT